MKFKTPQGGHVHRRLERDGLGHLCANGRIEVPGDVFSKFFNEFSKRFDADVAHAEAIVACLTHPNHAPVKPKEVVSESQPSPEKKSHDVLIWVWRIIVALLLLGILLSGRAHAQSKSQLYCVKWQHSDGSSAGNFCSPFTIKEGTGATFARSGSTMTITVTGGAAAAGGSDTQLQYNSSTALAGISTATTNGTITTFKAGADLLFADPTDATKKTQFDLSNITTGTTRTVNIPNANSTTAQAISAVANNFITTMSAQGVFTLARPTCSNLSDAGTLCTSSTDFMEEPASNGLVAKTAANTSAARTISTADSTHVSVSNGDGVAGNPTLDTGSNIPTQASNGAANQVATYSGANKALVPATTLPTAAMPALTGAVTTSAGAVATSPGKIDVLDSSRFCQAAGANSTTYTCNLSPAITAYVTGTHYGFKADVANTAASTINLNAQGAKTIKKAVGGITTDLAANDMQAGQWVDLVYDGTNMQMQSTLGNAAAGSGTINAGATNAIPKYVGSTTIDDSLASDDGTTLAYTGTGGVSAPKYTATGSGAGDLELTQGSAPSFGSNAFDLFAPASITTSFGWKTPAAAATGIVRGDNSSNTVTLSQAELSGDCTTSGSNAITCTKTSGTSFTGAATMTLPVAIGNGGTGTASTLTGLMRGNASAMTAAELSGDATTSGSNVVTNVNLPDGVTQAGHLLATNIAAPASPAAGKNKLFSDSTDLRFHDKNASGVIGTTVVADTGASNNFLTAISAAGAISKAQPSFANLSGTATKGQLPASTVFNDQANTYSGAGLQDFSAMKFKPPTSVVGSLPSAAASTSLVYEVTDGASASDCVTGSGSTRVWCVSTGSAWTAIGDGGSGGSGASTGDSFITVSHDADLTAERTLAGTSNHITVTDGGANNSVTLDTGANVTLSGALSNNTIPKANAAAGLVNSSITDDATTITLPELAVLSPTWNNIATLFTGLTENVTDTASQRNSLLADLQVGGSTRFKVEKAGTTTITGNPQPTQPGFFDLYGTPAFIGFPPSGSCRMYYDTTLGRIQGRNSSGVDCAPGVIGYYYVADWCAGSTDIGVCINNTIAAMPTSGGYKQGTMVLPPSRGYTWATTATIASPFVSLWGLGVGVSSFTCSVNGDCLRWSTNPFTITEAGYLNGFAIAGTGTASGVGIHLGDIVGLKLDGLYLTGFNGASGVCMWEENTLGWTESTDAGRVRFDNCTKELKMSVSGSGTSSFAYQRFRDIQHSPQAGQVGLSVENNGALDAGNYTAGCNATGAATCFQTLNTSEILDAQLDWTGEDGTTGGTFISQASTSTIRPASGSIMAYMGGGQLTNSINTNTNWTGILPVDRTAANPFLSFVDNGQGIKMNRGTLVSQWFSDASNAYFGTESAHGFVLRTNAANRITVASGGAITVSPVSTFNAKATFAGAGTAGAAINIASQTAPTSPVAGDVWTDTSEEKHLVATSTSGGIKLYDSGGTNSITDTSSGTITSYTNNKPLAAASGVQFGVNSSNTITQNFSGDGAHSLSQLAKTAAVTTFTLCAATAGTACGQAGQYRISYNFYGSGTACSSVTAGSVGLNLTWTDTNAVAHTTISLPMWDQKTAAMTNGLFNFNTALGTEGASGSYIISTNGTIIQAATTYTACTTGTGTYNLKMTVEQLQ